MVINSKLQPWCYWIRGGALKWQGHTIADDIEKRTWQFCFQKGVLILCRELGWDGGTIHQVISELQTATYSNA